MTDICEMKARITVFGVGGAGGNAVNNMIAAGLQGVDFIVANTDAQALTMSQGRAPHPDGHAGDGRSRRWLAS
ncbi:cell division GTPase FtsZ [Bradyrhizobium elkanii]